MRPAGPRRTRPTRLPATTRKRTAAATLLTAALLTSTLTTTLGTAHRETPASPGDLRGSGPGAFVETTGSAAADLARKPAAAETTSVLGKAFAGSAVEFDIATRGDRQYVAYYNARGHITLATRTLPDGTWSQRSIAPGSYGHRGADTFVETWNEHNTLRVAIDADGNAHLAGDMHAEPLRYWRTTKPGQLNTLRRANLGALGRGHRVTYPEFINDAAGNLRWLTYREGVSGNADTWAFRWNDRKHTWTQPVKVLAGHIRGNANASSSAYVEWQRHDSWYYALYNWRGSGDVASNAKLSLIKTRNFKTFHNAFGRRLHLPLTPRNVGGLIDAAPSGGRTSLINNEYALGITEAGLPVVAYTKADAHGRRNIFLARATTGKSWLRRQLTNDPAPNFLLGYRRENHLANLPGGTMAVDVGITQPTVRIEFNPDTLNLRSRGLAPHYYVLPEDITPGGDVGINWAADSISPAVTGTGSPRAELASTPTDPDTLYALRWRSDPGTFMKPSGARTPPGAPLTVVKLTTH